MVDSSNPSSPKDQGIIIIDTYHMNTLGYEIPEGPLIKECVFCDMVIKKYNKLYEVTFNKLNKKLTNFHDRMR